jgi:hypothetical protein
LGEINICPAGSRIEAANELTTSKIKSNTIGILTLETAATNVSAVDMVNDYSYGSVSGVLPLAENGQRKRPPLGRAAKRWGIRPSRGNDASGRNDRVLPKMVKTSALHHPLKSQADMRQVHPIDLESATLKSTPPMSNWGKLGATHLGGDPP